MSIFENDNDESKQYRLKLKEQEINFNKQIEDNDKY